MPTLEGWFAERPKWLQDAARRVIERGEIGSNDPRELTALCNVEVGITDPAFQDLKTVGISKGFLSTSQKSPGFRLSNIREPEGINALAPRKPVEFGPDQLTIVYDENGSGKAGYVRVLKRASGAREPGILLRNVFAKADEERCCSFKCLVGGAEKDFHWTFSRGPIDDVRAIQIYDDSCAHVYIDEENEVSFEPQLRNVFTELTDVCGLVSASIDWEPGSRSRKNPRRQLSFNHAGGTVVFGPNASDRYGRN